MQISSSTQNLIKASLESLPAEDSSMVVTDLHDHELDQIEEDLHVAHGAVEGVIEAHGQVMEAEAVTGSDESIKDSIKEHVAAIDALLEGAEVPAEAAPVFQASLEALAGSESQGKFKRAWEAFKCFIQHLVDKTMGFLSSIFGGLGRLKAQCAKLKAEAEKLPDEPKRGDGDKLRPRGTHVVKQYLFAARNAKQFISFIKKGVDLKGIIKDHYAAAIGYANDKKFIISGVLDHYNWPNGYGFNSKVSESGTYYIYSRVASNESQPEVIWAFTKPEINEALEACELLIESLTVSNEQERNDLHKLQSFYREEKIDFIRSVEGKVSSPAGYADTQRLIGVAMSNVTLLKRMGFVVCNAALKTAANAIRAY